MTARVDVVAISRGDEMDLHDFAAMCVASASSCTTRQEFTALLLQVESLPRPHEVISGFR